MFFWRVMMTKKIPKNFGKSIDWTVTSDKKQINSLNQKTRTIAEQLDQNPLPEKDELNPKKTGSDLFFNNMK